MELRLSCALVLGLPLLGACSVDTDGSVADAGGSTSALVAVERSTSADPNAGSRAGAFAGFVHVPSGADPTTVMTLVGLRRALPEPGSCSVDSTSYDPNVSLASMGRVELLDAGDIEVEALGAASTLEPRAFPTVTDFVSGVVYTTRDQSAEPLPAETSYTVRGSGSEGIGPFVSTHQAPKMVSGVTVGGIPLAELSSVALGAPIDITWDPDEASDLIYVELVGADGAAATLCAFSDNGIGTITPGHFEATGLGEISVHRVRVMELRGEGLDHGELRFDFELTAAVHYTR